MTTIAQALQVLSLDADILFRRIQTDLERGLVKEARSHLDFVDVLRNSLTKESPDTP